MKEDTNNVSNVQVDLDVYFNFRSPYCYLASKTMFSIFEDYKVNLIWKPFGGWNGRSSPERVKTKIHLVRQDIARSCKKMGIPFSPPPVETDPTLAGQVSFAAEREGLLKLYVVEVMREEWSKGRNIGDKNVLIDVADRIGLSRAAVEGAIGNEGWMTQLDKNWEDAQHKSVIGVPSFTVDDQVFWGNDRIDSLKEYLHDLRLRDI
jgi:2-hydroxychromene-2-carboxylate isomerase